MALWATPGSYPNGCNVLSPFETEMFHIGEKVSAEQRKTLVCRCASHGYQVQVAVHKNFVLTGTLTSSAVIIGYVSSLSSFCTWP